MTERLARLQVFWNGPDSYWWRVLIGIVVGVAIVALLVSIGDKFHLG